MVKMLLAQRYGEGHFEQGFRHLENAIAVQRFRDCPLLIKSNKVAVYYSDLGGIGVRLVS
jgi:hypothetical protein